MTGLTSLALGSALSYLAAVAIPALDALIPVLPSETVVIALGAATAGSRDPRIAVLVALAAAGAFLGDNLAYLLGRRFGPLARRRLFRGERGHRQLDWAERSLGRYGGRIIVACRFIPGGRTAVTLACGLTGYPRRRFVAATAVAAAAWAVQAFLLGRLGGQAFGDRPWAGLLLGLGLSLVITVLIEAGRRLAGRRPRPAQQDHAAFPPLAEGAFISVQSGVTCHQHPAASLTTPRAAGGAGGMRPPGDAASTPWADVQSGLRERLRP